MRIYREMTNLEVARLLRAVAAAYQIKNEEKNRFRIIAYQRAADAIEHLSSEVKDLWDDGKLEEVAGIGKNIAKHLDEIFRTGNSKHFKTIMKGLPLAMFNLMDVPGIGAKTAYKLAKELNLPYKNPLKALEKAAKAGKIAVIDGFGPDSQSDILRALEEVKRRTGRLLLPYADKIASQVIEWVKKDKAVKKIDPLGSLRRKASTIGDIDIAVATDNPKESLNHFIKYPKTKRVLEKGVRTASIIVTGGVQIDLMTQSPKAYGALLQHFTGSKHHNIALREYALKKGFSLSEYGIKKFKIKNEKFKIKKSKLIKFKDEESFYKFLGMEWIPPELREDTGEIQAALNGKLPQLVELKDIKADLQIHSSFNIETSHDLGESSMEELVQKANKLGYEYLAFTEHNPSQSGHNKKQIINIVKRKKEEIDKLNYSLVKSDTRLRETSARQVKKVFNSLEIDILPNGKLAVPNKALVLLDFVIVSVHSSFRQDRKKATKRILAALAHPKVKILAHPTTRILGKREGIELNWPQIFEFCKKHQKWLEINADPRRLDLPDMLVKEAIKYGVKLTLGTDAHHQVGLNNMRWGVSVARRGWAEKNDIINTRSLAEFEKMLK
jgi:DNA polymerase (family 10)